MTTSEYRQPIQFCDFILFYDDFLLYFIYLFKDCRLYVAEIICALVPLQLKLGPYEWLLAICQYSITPAPPLVKNVPNWI